MAAAVKYGPREHNAQITLPQSNNNIHTKKYNNMTHAIRTSEAASAGSVIDQKPKVDFVQGLTQPIVQPVTHPAIQYEPPI